MSGNVGKCPKATVDDFVPLFNAIVFNANEREVDVLLRVKQDEEEEEDECVLVSVKQVNMVQRQRRKRWIKAVGSSAETLIVRIIDTISPFCNYAKNVHSKCQDETRPICEEKNWGRCQACSTNTLRCPFPDKAQCLNDGRCVACDNSDQCGHLQNTKYCKNGKCVACLNNDHCDGICSESNVCVPCDDRGQCKIGQVCRGGRCGNCETDQECGWGVEKCKGTKKKNKLCQIVNCLIDNHCHHKERNHVETEEECAQLCKEYKPCDTQELDDGRCVMKATQPAATKCFADNKCGKCTKTSQCDHLDLTPICTPKIGCVQCQTNEHCKKNSPPYCNEATHDCQVCTDDEHCEDASLPKCLTNSADLKHSSCVLCLGSEDCTEPATPFCNEQHTCAANCQALESENKCGSRFPDRKGKVGKPYCHGQSGECVECENKDHCTGKKDKMNNAYYACSPANVCVQCTVRGDCSETPEAKQSQAYGCDAAANTCVECMQRDDCANHRIARNTGAYGCNLVTRKCVQCTKNVDCNPGQTCNQATHLCITTLNCKGFAYQGKNKDGTLLPAAPELKILKFMVGQPDVEKISFHLTDNLGPRTVNCPYLPPGHGGTKQWGDEDGDLQQLFLGLIAECQAAAQAQRYTWVWSADANAFFRNVVARPNKVSGSFTTEVAVPSCFFL
eukprot:GFUD01065626.1.p1 GENE.GFUD01065626.1~~GFUD01065626.1.p1  ORF type:complete len:675 (+),score=97.27 GFUD01065626.1:358-2382(+)